nr:hypothetical protein GCM10020092_087500 [Actinoplanes digitatis]
MSSGTGSASATVALLDQRAHRGAGAAAQGLRGGRRAGGLVAEADGDDQRRRDRAERGELDHLAGGTGRAEQGQRRDQLSVERGGDALRAGGRQDRAALIGLTVQPDDDRVDGQFGRVAVDQAEGGCGVGHSGSPRRLGPGAPSWDAPTGVVTPARFAPDGVVPPMLTKVKAA